jgi:hypothetical protein
MSLSNLIAKIKTIQQSHPMLKTFGEGDIYDYVDNGGEIEYPVLWVVTQPSSYVTGTLRYRLLLVFADLLAEDKSNRLQLQSDQLQVAIDVISKLKLDNIYGFNINQNINIEFFQERFDDFTAGVSASIEIIDPTPLNLCQFPT